MTAASGPKRTPLYEVHKRLGARMVEFGGYTLPVQYSSIREEHAAVRESAGLFDVSHMGQLALTGPGAISAAERVFSRGVAAIAPGRIRYGMLCNEDGGVVDDVTCYRTAEDSIFWCVNASNIEKDQRWIESHCPDGAQLRNDSDATAMFALQGPASAEVLGKVCPAGAGALRRYRFERLEVAGCSAIVSRTGYTGADGFELYLPGSEAIDVFETLLREGAPLGLRPAGLGARDTLRLEAALPLYGHELDEGTSPLEAGLDRFVDLDAGGFIGADALVRQREAGLERRLVGFELEERGVAREGHAVVEGGRTVGKVTSGAPSPTLGKSIGLAYVSPDLARAGCRFEVVIRERCVRARVVDTPFV